MVDDVVIEAFEATHVAVAPSAVLRAGNTGIGLHIKFRAVEEAT